LALVGGLLLLGFIAVLILDVVRIRSDLTAGQDQLSHIQLTQLESRASIEASLGTADRRLRAGSGLARDSIPLKALALLPKVGTQVRAARQMSAAAAQVGDIAYQAAVTARSQLDAPRSGPADRLRLIDSLRTDLARVGRQLDQVQPHAEGPLLGTLARARVRLVDKLAKAKAQVADGLQVAGALRTMLAGPRTYLILAGNNAEMRSGGITTAAGLMHFDAGDLQTGAFISSFDLFLPDANAKRVSVPPEIKNLYGWMSPGQEWRTTDTSPNWPEVARIYAQMSAQSPFGPVDGVVFVDVVTLRSVLDVVGPVTVQDFRYTADNVLGQLLYTNYLQFPTADQTSSRRDVQSQVARAAFSALRGGSFSLPKLAHLLTDDARGRHLLAWSSNPAEEAMWTKLGFDGALRPDGLMVSVQNVSASKLDYFINPKVGVHVQPFSEHQQVDLTVTITNPRRAGSSAYVEGGSAGYVVPGDQRVFVLLYLPGAAYNVVSHEVAFTAGGTDGGMTVAGMIYIVPYGQTRQVHVGFSLPPDVHSVMLLPSSRLVPIPVVVDSGHGPYGATDAVPNRLPF
jgi:hypothetical protein